MQKGIYENNKLLTRFPVTRSFQRIRASLQLQMPIVIKCCPANYSGKFPQLNQLFLWWLTVCSYYSSNWAQKLRYSHINKNIQNLYLKIAGWNFFIPYGLYSSTLFDCCVQLKPGTRESYLRSLIISQSLLVSVIQHWDTLQDCKICLNRN